MSTVELPWQAGRRQLRVFAAVLLALAAALLWRVWDRGHEVSIVAAALLVVWAAVGIATPRAIRGLYLLWLAVITPIAWVVSNLILALIYFGLLSPLALLFRLAGRDALLLRRRSRDSLWHPRPPPGELDDYRRQS